MVDVSGPYSSPNAPNRRLSAQGDDGPTHQTWRSLKLLFSGQFYVPGKFPKFIIIISSRVKLYCKKVAVLVFEQKSNRYSAP